MCALLRQSSRIRLNGTCWSTKTSPRQSCINVNSAILKRSTSTASNPIFSCIRISPRWTFTSAKNARSRQNTSAISKEHILTHKDLSEVKTYKCGMCSFETKQHSYLKKHTVVHKDISETRGYRCKQCPFNRSIDTASRNMR
ncbi:hypothetical protein NQ317_007907 [Molorchus minor]|uniref:C2H2-type domain-containing protein n=1 Tax=Molorchus minor TaxID=1323400 RepID=A0ABQ9JTC5_9CUCU|nr:hypothetical protein NQ317_007907 [Molorchus minor]